jgi:hypothetical protein
MLALLRKFAAAEKPQILLKFHRGSKWLWIVAIPVSEATTLRSWLPWLVFMSLWANVVSHWGAERAIEAQLAAHKKAEDAPPKP